MAMYVSSRAINEHHHASPALWGAVPCWVERIMCHYSRLRQRDGRLHILKMGPSFDQPVPESARSTIRGYRRRLKPVDPDIVCGTRRG